MCVMTLCAGKRLQPSCGTQMLHPFTRSQSHEKHVTSPALAHNRLYACLLVIPGLPQPLPAAISLEYFGPSMKPLFSTPGIDQVSFSVLCAPHRSWFCKAVEPLQQYAWGALLPDEYLVCIKGRHIQSERVYSSPSPNPNWCVFLWINTMMMVMMVITI